MLVPGKLKCSIRLVPIANVALVRTLMLLICGATRVLYIVISVLLVNLSLGFSSAYLSVVVLVGPLINRPVVSRVHRLSVLEGGTFRRQQFLWFRLRIEAVRLGPSIPTTLVFFVMIRDS